MKLLFVCAFAVLLATPALAQDDLAKKVSELEERLTNSIKASVAKDAEIAKLKASVDQSPENIAKAIATRTTSFNTFKSSAVVKACKAAKGHALISSDAKGQLVYAGCIL